MLECHFNGFNRNTVQQAGFQSYLGKKRQVFLLLAALLLLFHIGFTPIKPNFGVSAEKLFV